MIDVESLRSQLHYDTVSGKFTRLDTQATQEKYKNRTAGSTNSEGYVSIWINHSRYKAHRLAWLYVTGERPEALIDHIDGSPSNNAWSNLRLATAKENSMNSRAKASNRVGTKGVSLRANGTYRARITIDGVRVNLGSFSTVEEAATVYNQYAKVHHGEFFKIT